MNKIDQKFEELRKTGRKAFIAFITAGYPNLETTRDLIIAFDRIGVDIVELGVPFSDPLADGPVIQESSFEALRNGTHLGGILDIVRQARSTVNIPICLMTYYNPVFRFGEKKFAQAASCVGADGAIVPDLPLEESVGLKNYLDAAGVDLIQFVAPTSTSQRIRQAASAARGFIYYVSLTGVTGARNELPADITKNIAAVKKHTDKPVCAGFGVSTHEQVRKVQSVADGVIVGSAIVKEIKNNLGRPDLAERVAHFVQQLKDQSTL